MKSININGRVLQYEVFCGDYSEWTEFYDGVETVTYRKWFFFGPKLTKEVPKEVFHFDYNIEDPYYTKEKIRKDLENKIKKLERIEEIKRGEII